MKKATSSFLQNTALFFIVLISFWFRLQSFIYQTYAFTYDVGRDLLAVAKIFSDGKIYLIGSTTGLHGVFYGPTWYYLIAPIFFIFQGSPRAVLFIIVLSGIATSAFGFLLGRKVKNYSLGLIIALYIGLSQVMTEISSQIWNPNMIPLFVIIIFWLLISLQINKNSIFQKRILLIGLLLGVIFDLEIVFGSLFFLSLLLYIITPIKKNTIFLILGNIFSGFILIQIPRILFEFRHDFLMTRTFFSAVASGSQEGMISQHPQFIKTIIIFFKVFSNTVAYQNMYLGFIILCFIISIFTLLRKKISTNETNLIRLLCLIICVFVVGLSFFNHDIESHYYIGIPVVFIILLALATHVLLSSFRFPLFFKIFTVIIFTLLLNQLKLFGTFNKQTWIGDVSVYKNQHAVVDYIYKDAHGKMFNTVTYTPPVHDYTYQYLFLLLSKKTGYLPDKNKQKLFYLIIEPDPQFPIRQKEWLKVREGDGVIVEQKFFPGGILLQKRYH